MGVHEVQNVFLALLHFRQELVFIVIVPVQHVVVKVDQGDKTPVLLDNERLVHTADVVDDALDFLGINVLARRTDNHAAQTAFDGIAAPLVHGSQVAGMEPSVVTEDLAGAVVIFVIAHHHSVALHHDFTLARSRIDIVQTDLKRPGVDAGRTDMRLKRTCIADEGGDFCHTVTDGIREAGLGQKAFHLLVQFCTADAEKLDASAESAFEFHSDQPIQQGRETLLQAFEEAALFYGRDDAGTINFLDDQRNGEHNGGPEFLEGGQ